MEDSVAAICIALVILMEPAEDHKMMHSKSVGFNPSLKYEQSLGVTPPITSSIGKHPMPETLNFGWFKQSHFKFG